MNTVENIILERDCLLKEVAEHATQARKLQETLKAVLKYCEDGSSSGAAAWDGHSTACNDIEDIITTSE